MSFSRSCHRDCLSLRHRLSTCSCLSYRVCVGSSLRRSTRRPLLVVSFRHSFRPPRAFDYYMMAATCHLCQFSSLYCVLLLPRLFVFLLLIVVCVVCLSCRLVAILVLIVIFVLCFALSCCLFCSRHLHVSSSSPSHSLSYLSLVRFLIAT